MAEDIETRLARMRRAMAKMAAEGREREFSALELAYAVLKRERDQEEASRLRAARVQARRVAAEGPRRWRLPRGFGTSPLAARRAREGRAEVPVVPVGRPALNPWRRSHPAAEVIWEPGRRR